MIHLITALLAMFGWHRLTKGTHLNGNLFIFCLVGFIGLVMSIRFEVYIEAPSSEEKTVFESIKRECKDLTLQNQTPKVVWCPPDKFGNRRDCDARLEPDPFLKFNNPCQRYFTWSRWLVVSEKDNGMKNFRDDWKHRHKNKDNYLINKEK